MDNLTSIIKKLKDRLTEQEQQIDQQKEIIRQLKELVKFAENNKKVL